MIRAEAQSRRRDEHFGGAWRVGQHRVRGAKGAVRRRPEGLRRWLAAAGGAAASPWRREWGSTEREGLRRRGGGQSGVARRAEEVAGGPWRHGGVGVA